MKSAKFNFKCADILSRRGDFIRDIRSVCDLNGQIFDCERIFSEDGNYIIARLWISGVTGNSHSTLTVAAFFDPSYDADIIIVPEFKLAFRYQWDGKNFNTEKVMLIMDKICCSKLSDHNLHEWNLLCIAASVCAVYDYVGRLEFGGFESGILHEFLIEPMGVAYMKMREFYIEQFLTLRTVSKLIY
jgi:hypothetical protein